MTLFRTGDPRPIHLMGIAGAGMSALALIARHRGVAITGCDSDASGTGADDLTALGVLVWRGHDPSHVEGARAVVVTAAVPLEHPELERARALGLPVVRSADALGELVAGGREGVVAVAGTHGKTTTTVMVTEALTAAGRNPTGLAGGRVAAWGGNARIGGDDLFVVEADEYDKAFLSLQPTIAVVNNVEADHLECYGSMEALEAAFADFAGRAGRVIIGADDAGADRVALHVKAPVWRVGHGATADVRIRAVRLGAGGLARRSVGQSARGSRRGRRRADLCGARAAAGGGDTSPGCARRDPGRCSDGCGARSGRADDPRRARGARGGRGVHARRRRHHEGRTRAAGDSGRREREAGSSRMRWKFRTPRLARASWRVLAWAGAAMLVMMIWMTAPLGLRRLRFFRVRQVEIVGIRHLDADQVLAALRLPERASVFDDTKVLADRLRGLDGVADASVNRRPPGSLQVIVREIEPVALVMSGRGALQPVDADGRELPFDLAGLDLPIVRAGGAGGAGDAGAGDSGVVGLLARVQAVDPALFQTIDAARRMEAQRGDVLLELGAHRVLLNRDAGPEVIEAVVLVARDLAAKARPYAELDARFAGQVVVRRRRAGSV